MIYIDGKKDHRIKNEELISYLSSLIRTKAEKIKDNK